MWAKAIEIIETAKSQVEAQVMVSGLRLQDGIWGVSVIGNGLSKPWAAQGFMDLPEGIKGSVLPNGMKIRMMRKQ